MRKIIFGFLTSFLFLESIVRILSPALGPPLTSWNTMEQVKSLKMQSLVTTGAKIDVVFMGNSTTWIGINPNTINADLNNTLKTFNAAMNSSTSLSIQDFASSFILPVVHPKYLIVLFSKEGLRTTNDNNLVTKTSPFAKSLSKYSYLIRYRNTLRDPMILNTLRRTVQLRSLNQGVVYRWANDVDLNGYSVFKQIAGAVNIKGWNVHQAVASKDDVTANVPEVGFKDLLKLNRDAKIWGTQLIIGTVPTLNYDPIYRSTIATLSAKLGIPFIQGNDAATQGKYFQDGVHLNYDGAELFSHFMAKQIANLY